MTPQRFEHLLSLVAPLISKKSTKLRSSISAAERLTLTLRYLASGDSQQSQAFNFRIGRSTVSTIIRETCEAIWSQLREIYLPTPTNPEEWKKISEEFSTLWHFPHCIGAGDGKHVVIECPKNSGSNFFNYKGTFSIVLLAYGDANYCFTAVDVGQYGRSNDSGAFANSALGKALESNSLNVPAAEHVQGCADKLPCVTVVDEGLPLKPYQMRPYPGKNLTEDRAIFNYRLSRARRIIENIFGILAARWRIFRRPIRADVATVEKIVLACICLHNYLRLTENASYAPTGFVDSEDNNGVIRSGDWRKITANDDGCFRSFQAHGGRYSYQANVVRENLSSISFHLKDRSHGNGITYGAVAPGAAENRLKLSIACKVGINVQI